MFKIEWRRMLWSKGFHIALIIMTIFVIWHQIGRVIPSYFYYQEWMEFMQDKGTCWYPSAYELWIDSSFSYIYSYIYHFAFPLIICMGYGLSYYTDYKSGWIKSIMCRSDRKSYYRSKLIVSFICGFMIAIYPLVLDLIITALFFPLKLPNPLNAQAGIYTYNVFCAMFYKYPYFYCGIYILLNGLYGGLMTVISIWISYLTSYSFLVVGMPFLIHLSTYTVLNLFDGIAFSPLVFLCAGSGFENYYWLYGIFIAIVVVLCFVIYRQGIAKDVC